MLTFKNQIAHRASLPSPADEDTLFFDIETTGFSPQKFHLYMIGCGYLEDDTFHTCQWFDETGSPDGEFLLLRAFRDFASGFKTCISYNGATFDFPFIRKKCDHYQMEDPLAHIAHTDIYKKLKPYRDFLGLPDLKQKSLENFLDIRREDPFSGGDLIKVYYQYIRYNGARERQWLIRHNFEDLCGMIRLLPVFSYFQFFEGQFEIEDVQTEGDTLTVGIRLRSAVPVPVKNRHGLAGIELAGNQGRMTVPGYTGTLKYFYEDYKNYYYLPDEDEAIHQSVAVYVDKSHRRRATRENCYTKKSGFFLPQPQILFAPAYRETAAASTQYFEWETIRNDPERLHRYLESLLKT